MPYGHIALRAGGIGMPPYKNGWMLNGCCLA